MDKSLHCYNEMFLIIVINNEFTVISEPGYCVCTDLLIFIRPSQSSLQELIRACLLPACYRASAD